MTMHRSASSSVRSDLFFDEEAGDFARNSVAAYTSTTRDSFFEPQKLRRTAWLDGLRGFASFQVYVFHSSYFWGYEKEQYMGKAWREHEDTSEWWRLPFIRLVYGSGSIMVPIFFIISGFVLTQKSLGQIRAKQYRALLENLSSSAFRRMFRIYLPMIVASLLTIILYRLGVGWSVNATDFDQDMSLRQAVVHWFSEINRLVNPFSYRDRLKETQNIYAKTSWTLPLEVYGSFVSYLLMLALARVSSFDVRALLLVFFMLYAAFNDSWHIFLFVFGILLSDYDLEEEQVMIGPFKARSSLSKFLSTLIWSSVLVCSLWIGSWGELFDPLGDHFLTSIWWLSLTGCGIVVSIYHLPRIRSWFESPLMQYLGRDSYGIYLIHFPIIELITTPYVQPFMEYFFGSSLAIWLSFVCQTALVLTLGHYFAIYVDMPSVQIARKIENLLIDRL